ncbi:MAG: acyltransferase [Chloroflexota bacterium]
MSRLRNRLLLKQSLRAGLKMGEDVRIIGKPAFGSSPYLVSIGNHVTVSAEVIFVTHDGATWVFRDLPQFRGLQKLGTIEIKDNCFIGTRAILMPGISIGPNSVVGAGAVVTRSVPANTVVAGSPARVISSTEEYLKRSLPRCGYFPPEVARNPKLMRKAVLEYLSAQSAEAVSDVAESAGKQAPGQGRGSGDRRELT